MAANKVKRSIHLTQPQLQNAKHARAADHKPERPRLNQEPTEQMPVRAHVYRTIADMNGGFEQVIEVLQTLQKIKHLPADSIKKIENQISERELANAGHFGRLCMEPESDTPHPPATH
ncbi:MAG TPA: hypothetical protein VHW72_06955 [Candidatus Angelobacter sp.]|nr:hypothetical protein [Candidatus Angelobacter sp.]